MRQSRPMWTASGSSELWLGTDIPHPGISEGPAEDLVLEEQGDLPTSQGRGHLKSGPSLGVKAGCHYARDCS